MSIIFAAQSGSAANVAEVALVTIRDNLYTSEHWLVTNTTETTNAQFSQEAVKWTAKTPEDANSTLQRFLRGLPKPITIISRSPNEDPRRLKEDLALQFPPRTTYSEAAPSNEDPNKNITTARPEGLLVCPFHPRLPDDKEDEEPQLRHLLNCALVKAFDTALSFTNKAYFQVRIPLLDRARERGPTDDPMKTHLFKDARREMDQILAGRTAPKIAYVVNLFQRDIIPPEDTSLMMKRALQRALEHMPVIAIAQIEPLTDWLHKICVAFELPTKFFTLANFKLFCRLQRRRKRTRLPYNTPLPTTDMDRLLNAPLETRYHDFEELLKTLEPSLDTELLYK